MNNIDFTKSLIWLFFAFFHLLAFAYPPLGEEEFKTIELIGIRIADACPKETCIVIGIGRSPTPIMAYLQAYDTAKAINLPLSNFRNKNLTNEQETILFNHFDKFIDPSHELAGKNEIIVLDLSTSGVSLSAAVFYIRKYVNTHLNLNIEIEPRAIVPQSKVGTVARLINSSDVISLNNYNDLMRSLDGSSYDQVSQYGEFRLDQNKEKEKITSSEYTDLKELMKVMPTLISDPKLKLIEALKNNNPEIRASAAMLLGDKIKPDDLDAIKSLTKAWEDPQSTVRSSSIKALGSIKPKDPEILKLLIGKIKDQDESLQRLVIRTLGAISPQDPAILEFLIKMLEDQNINERDAAMKALGVIKPKNPRILNVLIGKIKEPSIRPYAVKVLNMIGPEDPEILRSLAKNLEDQDPNIRYSTLEVLNQIHPSGINEEFFTNLSCSLAALMHDPNELDTIKIAALNILTKILLVGFIPLKSIYVHLISSLGANDGSVRHNIVNALLNLNVTKDNQAYLKVLVPYLKDQRDDVRAAIMSLLASAFRKLQATNEPINQKIIEDITDIAKNNVDERIRNTAKLLITPFTKI
jgi:HEAT repeat protein